MRGILLLGVGLAIAPACSTTVPGSQNGNGGNADAASVLLPVDASPDVATCANQKIPGSFGQVQLQGLHDEDNYPDGLLLTYFMAPGTSSDMLELQFVKSAAPFGTQLSGPHTFVFSAGTQAICGQDKACAYLQSRQNDGLYPIERGSLTITFSEASIPPPVGVCQSHDGDVAGCDAEAGCGYFFCSNHCEPGGTTQCNAGCIGACGVSGELSGATFRDPGDPGCASTIDDATLLMETPQ